MVIPAGAEARRRVRPGGVRARYPHHARAAAVGDEPAGAPGAVRRRAGGGAEFARRNRGRPGAHGHRVRWRTHRPPGRPRRDAGKSPPRAPPRGGCAASPCRSSFSCSSAAPLGRRSALATTPASTAGSRRRARRSSCCPRCCFSSARQMESHLTSHGTACATTSPTSTASQQKIRRLRPWFEPSPHGCRCWRGCSALFPENGDVWAKSIQISSGYKVTCTGFARNQKALLACHQPARPTERERRAAREPRGENPIQFTLTYHGRRHA